MVQQEKRTIANPTVISAHLAAAPKLAAKQLPLLHEMEQRAGERRDVGGRDDSIFRQ